MITGAIAKNNGLKIREMQGIHRLGIISREAFKLEKFWVGIVVRPSFRLHNRSDDRTFEGVTFAVKVEPSLDPDPQRLSVHLLIYCYCVNYASKKKTPVFLHVSKYKSPNVHYLQKDISAYKSDEKTLGHPMA
uniref:Uncharacterized protein n=1 Tax=Romanomermis culicivorax TaxID=13658 RepID=A0A915J4D1_ROMCU